MNDLVHQLEQVGIVVVGATPSVDQALTLIAADPEIDAAVIEILDGEMGHAVINALRDRALPFIFVTGYDDEVLNERYPAVSRVQKP